MRHLLIGRPHASAMWHLVHYVGSARPTSRWSGYRSACCGYKVKGGWSMIKQITYGQPTCKNCLAKLAGLRGSLSL